MALPALALLALLPLAQDAFVTTSAGLGVLDTATGKSIVTLPLGPGNAAVTPDGAKVYVTQTASATVLVLDAATQKTVTTINAGKGPSVIALSPDGMQAFVTNELDNTVTAIDTASQAILATIAVGNRPFGIAVSTDGSVVYVANSGSNTVSVIDRAALLVTSTITLPFPVVPWMVAFSIDGEKAYVTDNGYGHVYVISTGTGSVTSSFRPASYNQGVAFSPNGAQAYVTDASGAVNVIDALTDTVIRSVALGGNPAGIAFSSDGTKAFIANGPLKEVQIVDTNSFAVTAIPVPGQPTAFGVFTQPGGGPAIAAIGNGFTFEPGESPGAFFVITGTNLASATLSFPGASLPLQLAATMVLLDGTPIPLYFVSPTQINAQIPTTTAVSLSSVTVVNGIEESNRLEFPVEQAAPGIPAHVLNGDNSVNSAANPARPGSLVTVYFTGIGPVTNPVPSGQPAPASPLSSALLAVAVTIGGTPIEPFFAGLSPGSIGLAQANVQVPVLAPGAYPLVISIAGAASNSVLLSVGN